MTDVITVGLGLDTSRFTAGAQQAASALGPVESKLTSTQRATQKFEGSLKEVTKGAQGVGQVTRGFGDFARAISEGATSAAAFTAIGLGIEVAKTVDDFRDLTAAVTVSNVATQVATVERDALGVATVRMATATVGATAATGTLWTVLKANPLIVITAAIAAIGVAMSLFANKTKSAATDLKRLREEGEAIQARITASKDFGKDVELSALRQQQSRLFDAAVDIRRGNQPIPFRSLIQGSGLSPAEFVSLDPNSRSISPSLAASIAENDRTSPRANTLGDFQISPERATQTYGAIYETLGSRIAGIEQANKDAEDIKRDKAKQRAEEIKESIKESNQALDEMIQKAETIGSALGGAWVDFLAGAGSADQILKSLVYDIARQQVSQSTGALFGSIFKPPAGSPSAPNSPGNTTPASTSNGWGSGMGSPTQVSAFAF